MAILGMAIMSPVCGPAAILRYKTFLIIWVTTHLVPLTIIRASKDRRTITGHPALRLSVVPFQSFRGNLKTLLGNLISQYPQQRCLLMSTLWPPLGTCLSSCH